MTVRHAPVAAGYVLLVLVHGALGLPMRQPHVFADELGYLGHARHLAGAAPMPDMGTTTYYHFGYSLFLVPGFAAFDDPSTAYRAAILTNGLLLSLLFPLLHFTLHRQLGIDERVSLGASFVACLYPAFLLQSNFAWAENALIPGYAAFIAAFGVLVRRPSIAAGLGLGILTAFLYAVHPRALPLLPVTAVALVALSSRRLAPWTTTLPGVAAIVLTFLITDLANDHLRAIGWSPQRGPVSPGAFLSRAQHGWGLVLSSAGQALYLVQASCGIVLLGPLWLVRISWAARGRIRSLPFDRHAVLVVAFLVLTTLVLFAVSSVATARGGRRADHVMYGRYNEVFLPHYLALSLVLLSDARKSLGRFAAPLCVLGTLGALTGLVSAFRADDLDRIYVSSNILGIYPALSALRRIDPVITSLVAAALFLLVYGLARRRPVAGTAAAAAIFAASSLYTYEAYCRTAQRQVATADDVPGRIRELGGAPAVGFDTRLSEYESSNRFYSVQFLLPQSRVERFNSTEGERPPAPVVISTRSWPDAPVLRARFVTSERASELALWLLPGSPHYFSATQSFTGVSIGWRHFPGVWESGFHQTEGGRRRGFRWTNGRAKLVVPVNEFPTHLTTHLRPAAPDARVRIAVNGVAVFDGRYPAGVRTFDLSRCPLDEWVTIELTSDTITAARGPRGADGRTIGVAVRDVRLERR